MDNKQLNTVKAAFAFHYHRDIMNAATHVAAARFSPLTFDLAAALATEGETTAEIEEVNNHVGNYPQDRGREMIR